MLDLLTPYSPACALRSADQLSATGRTSAAEAPQLWNNFTPRQATSVIF